MLLISSSFGGLPFLYIFPSDLHDFIWCSYLSCNGELISYTVDSRCYIGIQSKLPSCGRSKCNGAIGYIGSIGKDKFGEEMTKNLSSAGVNVHYYN
ncbi:hypothetical protein CMV_025931 [Castanea mollissima]|uniref:Uncharacterized protein n=1 Tax=Castanea mollissima TaxID=60419 RepID=A0A8J4QDC2_9ROSI|nr:hypothetical protein CMV_025931 [Castanea mollissima]